ncbi:MAG: hypothetical protein K2Y33_03605 [Mycolicibacterium frederiksbergense]|nr:hypothetical protein [Mycolicibacterium frederiksbergense]
MRLHLKAGLLLAAAVVAGACTGVPERESQALDIRDRVAAMQGVNDVDLVYGNGIMEGTLFELRAGMENATNDQIDAVAEEIDAARGDDFAGYNQRIELDITDRVGIHASAELPDDTGAVAGLLRELTTRITAQSIDWYVTPDGGTRIAIQDAAATGAVVDTVLQVLADRPLDSIEVNPPAGSNEEPPWWIRTRLRTQDKRDIDARLAALAPATPDLIVVRDGRIVQLNVDIPSPEMAYHDVVHVIDVLGAGPQHPLKLLWSWKDDPARYGDLRWSGGIDIGECGDPNANTGSPDDLVPAAKKLQQRIRDEYGGCPK